MIWSLRKIRSDSNRIDNEVLSSSTGIASWREKSVQPTEKLKKHDSSNNQCRVIDDGFNEDKLGLDTVYVQAKRFAAENEVGRPALNAFVGSLTTEGANKGGFVTTSDFSREARDYVSRLQQRIVPINGDRLARLMIRHDVGVRARKTYVLRTVDEDYCSEM